MLKVSIIIPVYNTEKYLTKCLDSVLGQTLKDIEVICVNDCSTDGSLTVLQEYAAKDSRVRIINFEENRGVSVARNVGINEAQGEYLGFIDSDDFIDLDFYEKLYNAALTERADCAKGNVFFFDEKQNISYLSSWYNNNEKIRNNPELFMYGFTSAIYKLDFIKENKIYFPENIKYFEDPYFSIKATMTLKKIAIENEAKYFYRKNEQSICSTIDNNERYKSILNSIKEIFLFLNSSEISEQHYNNVVDFLVSSFVDINKIQNLSSGEISTIIDGLFTIHKAYKYSNNKIFNAKLFSIINNYTEQIKILDDCSNIFRRECLEAKKTDNGDYKNEIFLISVVNNFSLYDVFFRKNPFVAMQSKIKLCPLDNVEKNLPISICYNKFIREFDYNRDAWCIFCHSDWEILQNIEETINTLDKGCLYGIVGAKSEFSGEKGYIKYIGYCRERQRNGSNIRTLDYPNDLNESVETVDCVALFVHSSLLQKYDLQFDENLYWDLYVEDFCIQAKKKYGVLTYPLNISSCHWSDAGYRELPSSYYKSLAYMNNKYPEDIFAGTCGWIGGKKIQKMSYKEMLLQKMRNSVKQASDKRG